MQSGEHEKEMGSKKMRKNVEIKEREVAAGWNPQVERHVETDILYGRKYVYGGKVTYSHYLVELSGGNYMREIRNENINSIGGIARHENRKIGK